MKDSINYFYNFNVAEVEEQGEIYYFKINQDEFYFVPLTRSAEEVEDIMEISRELKRKMVDVHDIIVNKFGRVITNTLNRNYILLKPNGNKNEVIDLNIITKFSKMLRVSDNKGKLYRNSWALLWSEKIDYFEYQIREIGKDKKIILDSFSYYVGLAENAISYVNHVNQKYQLTSKDNISLQHRRILFPNYKLNYLNPLSFIFDLEVRDVASFIKSAFFEGEDAFNYLKMVLRINTYTIYSLSMLYARLLYPTYYFDIYERVMNKNTDEEELIPVIEKAEDYEKFLKDAYFLIAKYGNIERIEWLLK